MAEESQVEFHARWVEAAGADVQRSARRWKAWLIAFVVLSAAYFTAEFVPAIHRAEWISLAIGIPYLISMLGVGIAGSKLMDAKKFLRESRQGLIQEIKKQSLM